MNCMFYCDSVTAAQIFPPPYFLPHLVLEMVSLVAIAANKNRGNLALNRELDKFSIL